MWDVALKFIFGGGEKYQEAIKLAKVIGTERTADAVVEFFSEAQQKAPTGQNTRSSSTDDVVEFIIESQHNSPSNSVASQVAFSAGLRECAP